MSQISKCPTLRVVLGYWEALGEVSEMRYNNLLYSSSKRSYCSALPTTAYVKMIDIWMIFTMIVPLLEITGHAYSEDLKMKLEEVDEQKEISDVDRDKR